MGIGDIARDGFGAWGRAKENEKNRQAAKEDRAARMKMFEAMDFEPMYASENVPTYQKTKSPVARSYLESFLMGNNPDSTLSIAPNAAVTKKAQQQKQNAMFGTPEERMAQQRAVAAETPWKVTAPTRPVVTPQREEATWQAKYPRATAMGLSQADYDGLVAKGVILPKEGEDINGMDRIFIDTYMDKTKWKPGEPVTAENKWGYNKKDQGWMGIGK
jgi:hypothetical protein